MSLRLPLFYFPPVSWWAAAIIQPEIWLNGSQPYQKQQYTSRTLIRTPAGALALTVPVNQRSQRLPVMQKTISYAENWQRKHLRSIETYYRNAPYFEHFHPELQTLLSSSPQTLGELNHLSIQWLVKAFGWKGMIHLDPAVTAPDMPRLHLNTQFDPQRKIYPEGMTQQPYYQVFDGFVPDLSGIDLLLNLGPHARGHLLKSNPANLTGGAPRKAEPNEWADG